MRRTLAVLAMSVFPLLAFAADPDNPTENVVRCKFSDAKPTCGAASRVDFVQELGVSLDYLNGIGHRISVARAKPDPVELAMAGQALAVAEKVSGKQASITSAQVIGEALDLAKMRGVSTELSAIALVVTDPEAQHGLTKAVALAEKREAEAAAKTTSGESAKELFGTLRVINHSDECLRIHVSGRYVGTVHAGRTGYFHVHDHSNPTHFDAYCEHDGELVREANLWGHRHSATWHID
jgi:hypothetical protein